MAETKMKLWWVPQIPMKAFEVDIESLEQGVKLPHVLAEYDLFQFENNVKPDYSNIGGIVVLQPNGEWEDWYDDETGEDDPRQFIAQRAALTQPGTAQ